MNIVCIIPARGDSKEIVDKNIIDFCGKPLLAWSIEQALSSSYIKSIYVSSDSNQILSISERYGARSIKRPKEIARDESTSEEALIHAITQIEKNTNERIDFVVFLQGTSPLRDSSDIDSAIDIFIKDNLDSLFSVCDLKDLMVWRNIDNELESINYDYKKRQRRQDIQKQYGENGSIYIFKPEIIKKYLKNWW